MTHTDPRNRRRRDFAPPVDALAAAVRLDQAVADMRTRVLEGGPEPLEDEPPTGLLDLAAVRAALGGTAEDVDPAAAAWLAGGPDPAAARVLEQVDQLDSEGRPPGHPAYCAPGCIHVDREPEPERITYAPDVAAVLEPEHEHAWTLDGRCQLCGERVDLEPVVGPYVAGGQVAPVEPEPVFDPGPNVPQLDDTQVHVPESAPPAPVEPEAVAPPRPPAPARVFTSEREPRPGWSSRHDPRSRNFGVRALLGAAPLQDVDLPLGPVLDQGQEGECVGCGTVDATNVLRLLAGRRDLLKIDAAAALYHRAQQLDDVPGADYTGTSVLAGMQAGVEAGYFPSYLWAFGTRDIASALGHGRPVVIGVPWLSGMYDTGPGGVVEVKGDDTGAGHCLAVVKLRLAGPQGQPGPWFGWLNSWGRSYGDQGIGWIHHRDLAALLHGVGEAAVPGALP